MFEVRGLSVAFDQGGGPVEVVHQVDLTVNAAETVCLVGESGSGKTVTGLALMGLLDRRVARVSGQATLDGTDLLALSPRRWRDVRGSKIAMVFQEPMTALDPVFTVGSQLTETLRAHTSITARAAKARAVELLDSVGIADPQRRFDAYPHEMSGGMRQRVAIALALACEPRIIIADEPTTAVDVTIQAQLLRLFARVSREHSTAILMITHDLGVVAEVASRVYTMYDGRVVETGPVDDVLETPAHPYTSGLLMALPRPSLRGQRLKNIPGRVPSAGEELPGCSFMPRCGFAGAECAVEQPPLLPVSGGRAVRCVRHGQIELAGALS